MSNPILSKIKDKPWYEQPKLLAMPQLIKMRDDLRAKNLYDTEEPPMPENTGDIDESVRQNRTTDGSWNDLKCPMMGATGRRFGRNFPLPETAPDTANLMNPSPRQVSQELMTRTKFQPATILNLMAASWIQFMVHDWFVHRLADDSAEVPLSAGDPWPEKPMKIRRTQPDGAPAGSTHPPAYVNDNSHWWDGSQIYGCDATTASRLRTGEGGKLRVGADGRLPLDAVTDTELTGFTQNFWIGLSMLHGLFALEHNAICDALLAAYPNRNVDAWLFQKARLINTALLAKIHTIEWTPAILPHPVIQIAMNTNWNGLLGDLQDTFKNLNDNELLGGIIGSPHDHHTAPYSLTEEFVAVYRMHALIPDDYTFRSASDNKVIGEYTLPQIFGHAGRDLSHQIDLADLFYSFGRSYPGAVRLHNYPKHLQELRTDSGDLIDLASIDIFRDRERGVPRYNRFRRLLRKDPVASFEELTDNPIWREELRRVYNNDIEQVDLMSGLYAEPLPEGFGFSETAFRIFVLMASRRLKSDRFFTDDYTPETYTPEGLEWVKKNSMLTVLKRHFPALKPALEGVDNAFHPWKEVK